MAITTTKFDSGYQTTFDETGTGPEISGRELLGHITFGAAVGGITVEVRTGGAWVALGPEVTADLGLTKFSERTNKMYRFRLRCSTYTSGTITCNYDAG